MDKDNDELSQYIDYNGGQGEHARTEEQSTGSNATVKKVIANIIDFVDIMTDDNFSTIFNHPTIPPDTRQHVKSMYDSLPAAANNQQINENCFKAGYSVIMDSSTAPWTDKLKYFQRGCRIFYEVIKLVVVIYTIKLPGRDGPAHYDVSRLDGYESDRADDEESGRPECMGDSGIRL
ncbi:7011_t:CDS:2 [Paraglomus occultum]|uniref:7011_t:CDS:1 n=1 Tax=Paraglomus occultum TaxID=144539 RepID=A0A9N9FY69_9GLOM|nr:7011_t:CDS:2 [Paraglomus occultum]